MSVRNAGNAIREARIKAGLSQEKLSEGICSALSLSRIENGTAGVSPGTFQALMSRAGAPCEVFPIFANRSDFDCFYTLKRVRFYIDSWQLKEAYDDLEKVENWNFADNKFYYQEWVLCHCRLQFRSGKGNHTQIKHSTLQALHISRPHIDVMDFRKLLLSINEMELLIYYAQAALYTNEPDVCLSICTQLSAYLENSQLSFIDKEKLLSENAVVYAKYYISQEDYSSALNLAKTYFDKLALNTDDTTRHELAFLMGLSNFYLEQKETALVYFKAAFFSAHSIGSCYATICLNYLVNELCLDMSNILMLAPALPLNSFPLKHITDTNHYSDGSYDLFAPEVITLGSLIRELRMEQKISQQALCHGLCSKSKLSKIENNTLQPSVILAETMLQRLGIADVVFTFFGSDKEKTLDDLRYKISYTPLKEEELCQAYINQMERLISKEDSLYYQCLLFERALHTNDHIIRIELLLEALNITMPDFDFNISKKQCLSLNEFYILANLCRSYTKNNMTLNGLSLYFRLFEYVTTCNKDLLDKKRGFTALLIKLAASLYTLKHFQELCNLQPYFSASALKGYIYELGNILAHYAQALGECAKTTELPLYSCYAYYNFFITHSVHTEHFKQIMLDDWEHHIC